MPMRAIVVRDKALHIENVPSPTPGPNDILINVRACGVNRADLLQRDGHYPPPPGASDILDHVGARYLARDLDPLALDGRIVIIGGMGGQRTAEVDVSTLLGKRAQIIGSTLRSRSVESKAAIVRAFLDQFGADLEAGRVRPVISKVFPLERAD